MRSRGPLSLLALTLAVASCTDRATGPRPERVEPARASASQATTITIRGSGFTPAIRASYDDPASSVVSTAFGVRLRSGGSSVSLTDVRYLARDELQAVVPAGLAPGRYTLTVVDPRGRSGELVDAFEILGASDGGPADGGDAGPDADGPAADAPPQEPDGGQSDTLAPDTLAPDTLAPDTLAPDTLAPDTLAPDTLAPDTFAPDSSNPASPLDPFGAPSKLGAVSTGNDEDDPTLAIDMLELVFARGDDLWVTTRASLSAPWGAATKLTTLSTSAEETTPFLTRDGLGIIFSSTRSHPQAKGSGDLYLSTRATRQSPWSTPAPISKLNSAQKEVMGSMTSDGKTIVFASNRSGSQGSFDIYIATRPVTQANWGNPTSLAGVNTSSTDSMPWIADSLTVLYFSSDRPGGAGGSDIWVATRATPSSTFGTPQSLPGINTSASETDAWFSQDQRTVYFMSTRDGQDDLFVATR